MEEIDFGAVSYDCPVSASVVLTNTSDISMVWRARVPQDGTFRKRELTITPSAGTLSPGQSVDLLVELMSQTVKVRRRAAVPHVGNAKVRVHAYHRSVARFCLIERALVFRQRPLSRTRQQNQCLGSFRGYVPFSYG